jgi:sulfite exporter TauE/SafE
MASAAGLAVLAHLGVGGATSVELGVFFVVGLLGGAHCLGMCGPLVTMYADRMNAQRTDGGQPTANRGGASQRGDLLTLYEVRQHALFNLGRTVSYATIGAAFGLAGMVLFDASSITQYEQPIRFVTGFVVGLVILASGVRYLLGNFGGHSFLGSGAFSWIYGRIESKVDDWATGPGIFGFGLVHGFLPCPLLYPAFLYVFAQGSPVGGAVSLALLGLGTFPTLFLYGTLIQSVGAGTRTRLHQALGVGFLAMGWMLLSHSLGLIGIQVPHIEIPIYQPL